MIWYFDALRATRAMELRSIFSAPRARSAFAVGAGVCAALFAVGCLTNSTELEDVTVPRIYSEAGTATGLSQGGDGRTVALPGSGRRFAIAAKPLINEFEIVDAEVVDVELGKALLLELDGRPARELYRFSGDNMGQHLIVTINGKAIGARRIDGAIQNGKFYTFVEISDQALVDLVLELKDSLETLQKAKRKRG